MKMKYGVIYELYNALIKMQDISGFKIAWAVAKNIKILQNEAEFFENRRIKLLRKYGQEKDGKLSISNDDEHFQDFIQDFTELSNMEINVDLYRIKGDIKDNDIQCNNATAKDYLLFIEWIIENNDPEEDDLK